MWQGGLIEKFPFLPLVNTQTHLNSGHCAHSNQTYTLKKSHGLLESAVISKTNHIKQLHGFYQISPYLADVILHENNIRIENGYKN